MEPLSIYNKGSGPGAGHRKGIPQEAALQMRWEVSIEVIRWEKVGHCKEPLKGGNCIQTVEGTDTKSSRNRKEGTLGEERRARRSWGSRPGSTTRSR